LSSDEEAGEADGDCDEAESSDDDDDDRCVVHVVQPTATSHTHRHINSMLCYFNITLIYKSVGHPFVT